MLMPPLVALFYDHLIWPSSAFMDSTSLCTDVVAGTIVALMQRQQEMNAFVWLGLVGWSVLGAAHTLLPHNSNRPLAILVHIGVPVGGLWCIWAGTSRNVVAYNSGNNETITTMNALSGGKELAQWPFVCRSAFYLLLSIIDTYALRPPTQREKDKVCVMRYGALLVAPMVPAFLLCCSLLVISQAAKVYQETQVHSWFSAESNPQQSQRLEEGVVQLKCFAKAAPPSSHNTATGGVDHLGFEEAFRLAKMQYMDGKSSH
jgi:hypothetical protein